MAMCEWKRMEGARHVGPVGCVRLVYMKFFLVHGVPHENTNHDKYWYFGLSYGVILR